MVSEVFGCCSSYANCSDVGYCIRTDDFYQGCQYRKNLEAGHNFYNKKEEKIMELKITITNAEEIVQAINNLASALKGVNTAPQKTEEKKTSTKAVETKTKTVEKPPVVEPLPCVTEYVAPVVEESFDDMFGDPAVDKVYTFEEVKAKLAALSQSGKQAEMKQLIMSYGVTKLSDIPAEKYTELMKKVEKYG